MTVALPPLLMFRIMKSVFKKKRLRAELISALPSLGTFAIIWAYGEMVGYVFGPGNALSKIE